MMDLREFELQLSHSFLFAAPMNIFLVAVVHMIFSCLW
jgi:hypothetical protein